MARAIIARAPAFGSECDGSMRTIVGIVGLMSRRFKIVSTKSICLPVERRMAVSKISWRTLRSALFPSRTFVNRQPALARCLSTSGQASEQTSKVLPNRRGKLRVETSTAYSFGIEALNFLKARVSTETFPKRCSLLGRASLSSRESNQNARDENYRGSRGNTKVSNGNVFQQ
jgi:hypothetical protein